MKKLLLISNSTNPGEAYLGWPLDFIREFVKKYEIRTLAFVPYAGVTVGWDDYHAKVASVLEPLGIKVMSVHHTDKPAEMVRQADAVAVGGGNTFSLVYHLYKSGLMQVIREVSLAGKPYMGWSAGSNVACPALKTTNDMPIIEPESFQCMDLIPFQINPHYLDAHPAGHGGETREQRIEEFLAANREMYVAGLREACLLEVTGNSMSLKGRHALRVFHYGQEPKEIPAGADVSFLLGV